MNELDGTAPNAEPIRSEKRAWQSPVMEELDVATATTSGYGAPVADAATYSS